MMYANTDVIRLIQEDLYTVNMIDESFKIVPFQLINLKCSLIFQVIFKYVVSKIFLLLIYNIYLIINSYPYFFIRVFNGLQSFGKCD